MSIVESGPLSVALWLASVMNWVSVCLPSKIGQGHTEVFVMKALLPIDRSTCSV